MCGFLIVSSKEPLAVQLFCVSLWKIWFFRNQVIFKQAVFYPIVVASGAHGFVEEFNLANPVTHAERCLRPPMEWSAPSHNFLKVNIDAGRDNLGKVTWGIVIRNHNKEAIYAAMEKSEVVAEPILAETLGLRWGMQVVRNRHLSNVVFELDASVVVNCFNGILDIASIEPFIKDCLELAVCIEGCSVVFVNRLCNSAAHELAQAAKTLGSRAWMGNAPLKDWSLFSSSLFI
ncbi:unnamed protein product [Trifolium pratense]|uniref:Uncharacterized protein n=1 Tax=Trifolium pratense TaxID=57577 RepID=A0ACB0J1I5_TRIPR|nr:unnamed protein product [Trifolium pratense]